MGAYKYDTKNGSTHGAASSPFEAQTVKIPPSDEIIKVGGNLISALCKHKRAAPGKPLMLYAMEDIPPLRTSGT